MTAAKPKIPRVYITAVDPETGDSKGITVYETTPAEFISRIRELIDDAADRARGAKPPKRKRRLSRT